MSLGASFVSLLLYVHPSSCWSSGTRRWLWQWRVYKSICATIPKVGRVLKPDGKVMIMDKRPHSKQADNAGNILAAMFYSCSMFSCLQSSLLTEPRIGYGACWGEERMTKTIEEYLILEKRVELPLLHALYFCSKKK